MAPRSEYARCAQGTLKIKYESSNTDRLDMKNNSVHTFEARQNKIKNSMSRLNENMHDCLTFKLL